jgi:hypothetical protein
VEESGLVVLNDEEDETRQDIDEAPLSPRVDAEIRQPIDELQQTEIVHREEEMVSESPRSTMERQDVNLDVEAEAPESPRPTTAENLHIEEEAPESLRPKIDENLDVEEDIVPVEEEAVPVAENVELQPTKPPCPDDLDHASKHPLSPVVESTEIKKAVPDSARKAPRLSFDLGDSYILDLKDAVDVLK